MSLSNVYSLCYIYIFHSVYLFIYLRSAQAHFTHSAVGRKATVTLI